MVDGSSVSLESKLVGTWLVSPAQSAGVCGYNITPAARTHSAPFSEEKSLMAFV